MFMFYWQKKYFYRYVGEITPCLNIVMRKNVSFDYDLKMNYESYECNSYERSFIAESYYVSKRYWQCSLTMMIDNDVKMIVYLDIKHIL